MAKAIHARIEQNAKNVLSTVLSILDVLGMTDKRKLVFPDQDFRFGMTEGVTFWGQDGATSSGPTPHYRADIEAFARRKYLTGQQEPDGSNVIRTGDLL